MPVRSGWGRACEHTISIKGTAFRTGGRGGGGKFSNSLAAIEHGKQLTKKIRNERAEINRGLCIVVVDESGNEVQSRTDLFWQCSNVIWTEGASGLPQC